MLVILVQLVLGELMLIPKWSFLCFLFGSLNSAYCYVISDLLIRIHSSPKKKCISSDCTVSVAGCGGCTAPISLNEITCWSGASNALAGVSSKPNLPGSAQFQSQGYTVPMQPLANT